MIMIRFLYVVQCSRSKARYRAVCCWLLVFYARGAGEKKKNDLYLFTCLRPLPTAYGRDGPSDDTTGNPHKHGAGGAHTQGVGIYIISRSAHIHEEMRRVQTTRVHIGGF